MYCIVLVPVVRELMICKCFSVFTKFQITCVKHGHHRIRSNVIEFDTWANRIRLEDNRIRPSKPEDHRFRLCQLSNSIISIVEFDYVHCRIRLCPLSNSIVLRWNREDLHDHPVSNSIKVWSNSTSWSFSNPDGVLHLLEFGMSIVEFGFVCSSWSRIRSPFIEFDTN